MGGTDYTKKERSTFCKRAPTLIKKAHELAEQCNAHVYVLIDHPRARVAYSSSNGGETPLPDDVLVMLENLYPGLQQLTQSGIQESSEETRREKVDGVFRYFEFRAQALSRMKDEEPEINTTGTEKQPH